MSEDSFAISSNTLATSINRCFLATGRQRVSTGESNKEVLLQELGLACAALIEGGRFRRILDIVQQLFVERDDEITEGSRLEVREKGLPFP